MPWQQLKIELNADSLETVEQYLLDSGSLSVSYLDAEDQPIFQEEPGAIPLWDRITLLSLFEASKNLDDILAWLRKQENIFNKTELASEVLEDQDWERSWMTDFKAMQFGEKLWICPSWQSPPDSDAVNIMLDPGLAFGSGSHATTSLCLQWLDQQDLSESDVIDYGCGSGILAIAAALLGAKSVTAVDNDPQAITATEDNSQRNELDPSRVLAYLPDDFQGSNETRADILIANILAEPLLQLAPRFAELLKVDGKIVLSGLLESQAEEIVLHYESWFDMDKPCIKDDWVRLSGRRRS
ncbi:MAG: 50S ribosomal protein L11 methyltransferase [Gammaproteobacteria bacterium]|jgi:ribosomal protein L11 methyltransferase|nr:50S ribosomal protein L11 methyltransferase [Gammaproteobacteria bacterium]MBT3858626.1 50S ribosomal protein L11 methyltransferase [Gammaproteobacteria bacterium]MBT3987761.1 50S ribosomal protein L11 methyltransferase [Gammaproteobacteria bacterium]MBT4256393.1 50S ribosomal protein L11 methyltransferase [Gammaproteobacteria bacterium]MBT4583243.1 50S ribosomal protein L11 methyltransferase [Gammaproteobacteria bacterium]